MRMNVGILSICLLLFTQSVEAENHESLKLIESGEGYWVLEFQLPQFAETRVFENSEEFTKIEIEGWQSTDIKAYPELPRLRKDLLISKSSDSISLEIISQDVKTRKVAPVLPSRGVLMRNEDPNSIEFVKGSFYRSDETYPVQAASLSEPFHFRETRGVSLMIQPFQYDAKSGELHQVQSMKLRVEEKSKSKKLTSAFSLSSRVNSEFFNLYSRHFLNFESHLNQIQLPEGETELDRFQILETGRLMIFVPVEWESELSEFVEWKKDRGYHVVVQAFDRETVSFEEIKSQIDDEYYFHRLSHVILVGDAEDLPFYPGVSGNAYKNEADPLYSLVSGDDYYPEVFVSRMTAKTAAELQVILSKVIGYEKYPEINGDWYSKAIGIASSEGAWSGLRDDERMDQVLSILGSFDYKSFTRIYEPNDNRDELIEAINSGAGFINYVGHGSSVSWGTSGLGVSDINNKLSNVGRLPFIVSVACVNGDFDYRWGDSFAEAWLKAGTVEEPKGAAAIFASSTNQSWIPPTVGQKKIAELMKLEAYDTIGPLFFHGSVAVIEDGSSSAKQTYETWHIFGDSTMQIRTRAPWKAPTRFPSTISRKAAKGVWVTTLPGAVTVFKSPNGKYRLPVIADAMGKAGVQFDTAPFLKWGNQIDVVVTAFNQSPSEFSILIKD